MADDRPVAAGRDGDEEGHVLDGRGCLRTCEITTYAI